MHFTKMHGIGNDYVYVNCFEASISNPSEVARKVSDRHYGIGSDGLILILPSDKADVRMRRPVDTLGRADDGAAAGRGRGRRSSRRSMCGSRRSASVRQPETEHGADRGRDHEPQIGAERHPVEVGFSWRLPSLGWGI